MSGDISELVSLHLITDIEPVCEMQWFTQPEQRSETRITVLMNVSLQRSKAIHFDALIGPKTRRKGLYST